MTTIQLSGGDFGGESAEVSGEGERVTRESATHRFTYEARLNDEGELVGVCVLVERKPKT